MLKTAEFLSSNPVFSLDDVVRELAPSGGRTGAIERLRHYVATGRLRSVSKGVYVVTKGSSPNRISPDYFHVALAARADAIFSYHSALELLGCAHSIWHVCTLYTAHRRRPLCLDYDKIEFLNDPNPLSNRHLGTETVEYDGKLLETTGPERTLVEGLLRPGRIGGIEEFINSAGGLPIPKLDLLEEILKLHNTKHLYAAAGWYLERCQEAWNIPSSFLGRMEKHRPGSPQYLERCSGFGKLFPRWNLILPRFVSKMGGLDEP
jgi:hypothetical protein